MSSILVTVFLAGKIGGPVAHKNRQKHTVLLSEDNGGSMTRVIKHTDRVVTEACRIFSVAGHHVDTWVQADQCPEWEKPKDWQNKTVNQRLTSHLLRFDEGFGVSFEFLGDNE